MKRNVLHIVYSLGVGGQENMILNYAIHLNKEKYTNFVCTINKEGPIASDLRKVGIKVFCLWKKKRYDFFSLVKIIKIIKKNDINIIHTHNPSGSMWGVTAAVLGGGRTIIRTEHTIYRPQKVSIIYPVINCVLNYFTDFIICCSNEVLKTHLKKKKLFRKKYIIIHNGIDEKAYKNKYDKAKIKKTLRIPEDSFIVGSVGNLTGPKGYEYLLDAFKIIRKNIKNVVLVVAGEGQLRQEIENKIKELQLEDSVFLLGLRNDIPKIISIFDVYASSSTREGLSIALLEAMASRKPIIVTDVGGNKEVIKDFETGLMVPPRESNILAEKIMLLLKDNNLCEKLSNNAFNHFRENFSIEKTIRLTEELYDACRG